MARYNPYNRGMMYPDIQDTPQVPYISYYDPQQVERLGNVIQQRGQRYDAAQAAIAKYLEEAGATEMRQPDRDAVISKITSDLESVKGKVKERYNGDYGLAVNDVIQGLSKSSGIYKQAAQKYKEEQKYLPLYQKLKSEGKLVTPKGYDPFQQAAFDEETGKFKDIDYSQMYERNDYNKWVKDNISDRLSQNVTDNLAGVIRNAKNTDDAFLIMQKVKGMSQEQIPNQISDTDVKLFLEQNPTYKVEFSDEKGNIDINAAKQFVVETAKNQVARQVDQQLINNPYWRDKSKETSDSGLTSFGVPIAGGIEENPYATRTTPLATAFESFNTPEDVDKAIKNSEASLNSLSTREGTNPQSIAQESEALERLRDRKEQLKAATEVLEDYKQKKTKELQTLGQPIPRNNKEWASLFDTDREYVYRTIDQDFTISPLAQKGIKTVWEDNRSLPRLKSYRIANESKLGNVDLEVAADKLDIDENMLSHQIMNGKKNYNSTTGEFYTTVSDGTLKGDTFTPKGEGKTVYFTLDDVTRDFSTALKRVKQIQSDKVTKGEVIPLPQQLQGMAIYYTGDGKYNIVKEHNGQFYKLEQSDLSVSELRSKVKDMVDGYVYNNFTKPALTFQQQSKL